MRVFSIFFRPPNLSKCFNPHEICQEKIKDPFDGLFNPSHPSHPSNPSNLSNSRFVLTRPLVLFLKASAGPRREASGLSSERIFIKEINLKMNRHKKIKNWEIAFNFRKEISLKMNDINIKEISLKMNRHKKSKIEKSPSIL